MKAAYYEGNKTFSVGESRPQAPGRGEVKLKVAYAGICGTDNHIYLGHMDQRLKLPQVIGHEMSGEIVEVGDGVEGFNVGDRVTVRPLDPCHNCPSCELGHFNICPHINFIGIDSPGAFQGWWTIPAHTLHLLPESVDMRQAAMIEPIAVACHDVRYGEVTDKDYVVVLGAGPIGMLNALVAKSKGARVLVLEINKFRLDLARELGMEAMNPLETDVPQYVEEQTRTAGADVVFEVSGSAAGAKLMTQLVRTGGRIVIVAIFADPVPVDLRRILWREMRVCGARNYASKDFEAAIQMVASRALPLDRLISDIRPLEQVQGTFQEIEKGANFMKVLLNCRD
ncbi:MAG: alcohol dehydrogenase catalytic domain-containing protein [Dehalococcoidia bacterium]|nr:alcohol dehydrogenase catalytic domain-containing protein [Dehalococcoidia bacterium]